eukprot:1676762-Pleurochrysis_carterae.AAC.1
MEEPVEYLALIDERMRDPSKAAEIGACAQRAPQRRRCTRETEWHGIQSQLQPDVLDLGSRDLRVLAFLQHATCDQGFSVH